MRYLLIALGFIFIALGVLGIFLPLLPTTPFLLVSAACFAKASPRLYNKMIENKLLGPFIRQWQENKSMPKRAKIIALSLIVFVCAPIILFSVLSKLLKAIALLSLLIPIIIILRIKTAES